MTHFRRLPALLRASLLLPVALAIAATASTAQAREMVSVDRSAANMRTGPGTKHELSWVLQRGYPLMVTGKQGAWIKVSDFEKDQGWMLRSLTGKKPHHIVSAKVANLRSEPNTRSRIVGKLEYGEVLRTVEKRGEWVKVQRDPSGTGWVAKNLLWGW